MHIDKQQADSHLVGSVTATFFVVAFLLDIFFDFSFACSGECCLSHRTIFRFISTTNAIYVRSNRAQMKKANKFIFVYVRGCHESNIYWMYVYVICIHKSDFLRYVNSKKTIFSYWKSKYTTKSFLSIYIIYIMCALCLSLYVAACELWVSMLESGGLNKCKVYQIQANDICTFYQRVQYVLKGWSEAK